MQNLKEAIQAMKQEIDTLDISDYVRHMLTIALEQIKDAAMRVDCPENDF